MVTRTEDSDWDPAVATGFFFRSERSVPFEIGMDYASLVGTLGGGETVESRMYHFRFDAILRRSSAARRASEFYLLAGGTGGVEDGTWNLTGDKFLGGGGGVNLGLGVASPRGLWDARVVYSVYASSEEVKGTLMTVVGVSF